MAAGELMTIPPENSEERAADLPQADDPPSPDGAPSLSADQIGRFLNAEEQRLALRSRELDLAEQDGKHGHEYALGRGAVQGATSIARTMPAKRGRGPARPRRRCGLDRGIDADQVPTWILFGCGVAFFGMVISSTPLTQRASTRSASAVSGRVKRR